MLVLIIVILIAVFLGCCYLEENFFSSDAAESACSFVSSIAMLAIVILGFCLILNIINVVHGISIDDKIEVYKTQNAEIEKTVSNIVENFQSYEQVIIEESKEINPTTLLTIYPKLKSNELVKEQVKVYVKNNDAIKELEVDKADIKASKYLLYFGN